MNIIKKIFGNTNSKSEKPLNKKNIQNFLTVDNDFNIFDIDTYNGDAYFLHAWVNIAVNILTRNIARADFTVKREGDDIECGAIYDLFRKPNPSLSRYDL